MYKIILDGKNGESREQDAGNWEDRAREQYAGVRRKLIHNTDIKMRVRLIDHDGRLVLEHDQRRETQRDS